MVFTAMRDVSMSYIHVLNFRTLDLWRILALYIRLGKIRLDGASSGLFDFNLNFAEKRHSNSNWNTRLAILQKYIITLIINLRHRTCLYFHHLRISTGLRVYIIIYISIFTKYMSMDSLDPFVFNIVSVIHNTWWRVSIDQQTPTRLASYKYISVGLLRYERYGSITT